MTTPTGTITMADIQTEFGGANPIGLSEYYSGGVYVSGAVSGVPASGAISMDNLRGKTATTYGALNYNYSSRTEGSSVTFTLSGGTGITNGTYYWRLEGTNITSGDFASLTGSFTITSNTGSFTVTPLSDGVIEGTESFRAVVSGVNGVPTPAVSSDYVSITETKIYTLGQTTTNANEGSGVGFWVTTTNVPYGTTLYFATTGTCVAADFYDNTLTGSFVTGSNLSFGGLPGGQFTRTLKSDLTTEGSQNFTMTVRTGSTSGTVVGTFNQVTVNDTSLNPPTYACSWSPPSIYEGNATTLTLNTTNVPTGTTLYWTLTGTGSYTDLALLNGATGTISTTGNSTTGVWYAAIDTLTESNETITISFRATSGTGGALLCPAATLTIYQNLVSVGTLIASKTGGSSPGTSVAIYLQIAYIAAYPVSRTFNITYSANGGAYTSAGLLTTTLTVAANATSSSSATMYTKAATTTLVSSLAFKLTSLGHADKVSNTLYNIYM